MQPPVKTEAVLEARDVSKAFVQGSTTIRAVNKVSLTVNKGQFVAIIGKSGSGKSTLLQLLGALDRADEGEIVIGGSSLRDCSDEQAAHIRGREVGFVFQNFSLLPRLSAVDNVALPLVYAREVKDMRRKQARDVLTSLGLEDRFDHLPSELSGGQQQRVAVARALIRNPAVVLADEPTGALDRASAGDLMDLLLSLHRSGRTLVIVTHDPDIARTAQVVVEMTDGRLTSIATSPH